MAVAELLSFSRALPNKRLISSCRRGITPHGSCFRFFILTRWTCQAIAIRHRSSPVSQIMSFGLSVPRRLIGLNPARRRPIETSHWAAPHPIGTLLCNPSALITMLMRCAAPASSKAMDTSSGSSKRCRLVSVRRHGERDLAVIRRRRKLYESPHL